ncbi:TonB-dependent receptor plug domain-containing protein [Desulfonatronovibrio magnus]|uniref:TonB-dependent receptor plug domain-containing protein n=1 Tax=Desulfonatronovibrio magnus TaxID=698827 RepID=UPI0005EBD891|nr:TonB-dependent receptor plug domain-containing protein [Desulfonatronovibrio magnus]
MKKSISFTMLVFFLSLPFAAAAEVYPDDGTMLMFVGEDIELLSIASRREETPARAPAVANVVRREEFMQRGQSTVSSILQSMPGFHMAGKEWGHRPYLRGMPDSVMFLYDTVPIGSELSKYLHPIDQELSLAAVKQLEIVRGPSSVLWGPDAFAGVVNITPLSGKDFQGAETGITYGEPGRQRGAYLNLGQDYGLWDGFISLSFRQGEEDSTRANLINFFDNDGSRPVPPERRMGSRKAGEAHYLDAYARLNLGKNFSLSGRLTDSFHPYIISNHRDDLRWRETTRIGSGYIKMDADHDISLETKIRLSGYFSRMTPENEIIDKTVKQREDTYYAELLMDRSMFDARGLLTAGTSFKHKKIDDAPIWDSYIPGYLGPDNKSFLPGLTTSNFSNRSWSPFVQYSHKLGDFDFMLGLRHDFHEEYKDNLSYSSALLWTPLSRWAFKLLYGTAYRTPFARQLLDDEKPDMEKSENISLQAAWNLRQNLSFTGTLFYNRLSNHIMEDPYAGLSQSNRQDIYGLELEANYNPWDILDLRAGLTLLQNKGPDEKYRYLEYSYRRPDGTIVHVYKNLRHPFDPGPKVMLDLMGTWSLTDRLSLFTHLEYYSSRKLIYAWAEDHEKASDVWMLNVGGTYRDFLTQGLDVSLKVRNLMDNRFHTPGTYSMMKDKGISGELTLRYVF